MLHAAAELTLDMAEGLQSEGFGLKDATPYNVLFRGPKPVFVDLLSFEKRNRNDPTWLPYAQFVRTFLLPLQASRFLGIRLDQLLMVRRDGLEPEELYRWLSPLRRLLPPSLTLATLPTWLAASRRPGDTSIYQNKLRKNPDQAAFILKSLSEDFAAGLARSRPLSTEIDLVSIHGLLQHVHSGFVPDEGIICPTGTRGVQAKGCAGCRLQHRSFQCSFRASWRTSACS